MNIPERSKYAIPEIAQKYMNYDMIVRYTELPEFPDCRTRLLFSFLREGGKEDHAASELYSLAASLAQVGLDTHDMVEPDAEAGDEPQTERTRQLRVLAGDYFSSWFYQLLSHAGRIDAVKSLAGAICEVNRLKMGFYQRIKELAVSAEEYIEHQVEVRSRLFLSFAQWMDDAHRFIWPGLLRTVTECEVLAEEYKRLASGKEVAYGWPFWYEREAGTSARADAALMDMLERKWSLALEKARQLPASPLVAELERIGDQLFRDLKLSPTNPG